MFGQEPQLPLDFLLGWVHDSRGGEGLGGRAPGQSSDGF